MQDFTAQEAVTSDFNGDQEVNFNDFFLFAEVFGQSAQGAALGFDLDGSGKVDFPDFFLFAENFGQGASAKRWAQTQINDPMAAVSLTLTGGDRSVGRPGAFASPGNADGRRTGLWIGVGLRRPGGPFP